MSNDNLTPDSIRQLLNRSIGQLDKDAVEQLRNSRNLALEHQRTLQHAPVQAWLSHHGLWTGSTHSFNKMLLLAFAALLAVFLYSSVGYQQHEHDHDDTTDIELLTDDLPVDAYLD